jgi:SAM-dependent methyltransferase
LHERTDFAHNRRALSDVWETHYATPAGFRYWPSEELIRTLASWPARPRVLEVGCGNGANLWALAEAAGEVVAVDGSARALDAATQLCHDRAVADRVRFIHAEARVALEAFEDATFDAIVDCLFSQHLPWHAHDRLYRSYARVLRPGGRLFLQHLDDWTTIEHRAPTARCASAVSRRDATPYDWPAIPLFPAAGLVCLPPPPTLLDALAHAGLPVTTSRGLAREYESGEVAHYTIADASRPS